MDQVKFVKIPFKKSEEMWPAWEDHITTDFLKAVFYKFYLVHYRIPWPTHLLLFNSKFSNVIFNFIFKTILPNISE